jgi:outer membrane protein assembly factor BamB
LFLLAEQLLLLSEEVLGAWQHARPLFRRIAFGDVRLGVRRGPGDGLIAFSVTAPRIRAERSSVTFPELDPGSFVGAATSFAHTLAQDIVEHDPAQRHNLRLGSLRRSTEQLAERLSDLTEDDSRENPLPDSYRAYAKRPRSSAAQGIWSDGGKMRFLPRWVATVPNVDLRATFLCGDHLIFGAEREIASVHRRTGDVVWRQPAQRATSVITPVGLVRIHPDGRTSMHDLETGEARFSAQLEPRNGTPPSGAVVHAPGLPKLLVVAEGERRITALDLVSGEVRWRHTARRPIAPRMRRAGKLIVLADGDASLLGLDVTTGEVVWRVRHRPPFSVELALDHDSAFAITGSRGASSGLAHVDPWSGALRWATELPDRHTPGLAPLVTSEAVVVPVRDARGSGAHGFCRNTGELLWSQPPGLCSPTTAWLAVDDAVVANSAAGSLVCLDAKTGIPRYSHVFSRHVVADQPRRLEPVLRSGALFVPQHEVHVVRPRDGELLGTVPTDLIPDLLRVDEHCDVYVVEESGHVAAFGAAPKLTLVR